MGVNKGGRGPRIHLRSPAHLNKSQERHDGYDTADYGVLYRHLNAGRAFTPVSTSENQAKRG